MVDIEDLTPYLEYHVSDDVGVRSAAEEEYLVANTGIISICRPVLIVVELGAVYARRESDMASCQEENTVTFADLAEVQRAGALHCRFPSVSNRNTKSASESAAKISSTMTIGIVDMFYESCKI